MSHTTLRDTQESNFTIGLAFEADWCHWCCDWLRLGYAQETEQLLTASMPVCIPVRCVFTINSVKCNVSRLSCLYFVVSAMLSKKLAEEICRNPLGAFGDDF